MTDSAMLAEVVRSGVVEGIHRGHVIVLSPDGSVQQSWGNPHAQILPRSANKIAQASAMVRAGLPLTGELLALAAASHSGEPFHVEGVRAILGDFAIDDLRNPADWPWDEVDRCDLRVAGGEPSRLYMNCSGKHAAMLVTCRINGWDVSDYLRVDHPLQVAIEAEVARLSGETPWTTATDGCGAPLFGLTLSGLARMATAALLAPGDDSARRVADAMRDYPEWVGGTRRESTALAAGVPGLLLKEGAEGVYVAGLPDGTGIAMKIDDGSARARQVVMASLLALLGVDSDVIRAQSESPVFGGGVRVGEVRATLT